MDNIFLFLIVIAIINTCNAQYKGKEFPPWMNASNSGCVCDDIDYEHSSVTGKHTQFTWLQVCA